VGNVRPFPVAPGANREPGKTRVDLMLAEHSKAQSTVVGDRSTRLPSRYYGAAVVFLAVFFAGLIAGRVPPSEYQVESVVGWDIPPMSGGNSGRASWDGFRAELLSEKPLETAIRCADAHCARRPIEAVESGLDERIRGVQAALRLQPAAKEGPALMRIVFTAADREWSMAFVEALARGFAQTPRHKPRADDGGPSIAAARWRADAARHYEQKARCDRQAFLEEHLSPAEIERLEKAGATSSTNTTASAHRPNPMWSQRQAVLAELGTQLDSLLATHTPNHPQVVDLTLRMIQQREVLDETPRYLGPDGWPADAGANRELVEAYARHEQACQLAVQERVAAEDRLTALTEQLRVSRRDSESRWVESKAAVTSELCGRMPVRRVAFIGLVAAVGSIVMATMVGSPKALARHDLAAGGECGGAALPGDSVSGATVWRRFRHWARRGGGVRVITAVCECGLALLLVAFAAGALQHGWSIDGLAEDPFAMIAHTVLRACHRVF